MLEHEWLRIYRDTVHPLYGYLAKRTGGNRELTEDIVQESYLRALDHWNFRTVPDCPLAWLKRVARNLLIDHLRQRRWDAKAGMEADPAGEPRTSGDEFESMEIFMALSSLGGKKARILEAFYFEGMSVKDIANEMAISERAVEGHLRRARRALRSLLPNSTNNGGSREQDL